MTTLATADVHFSDNPRDEYRFKFLEEWLPQAVEEHDVRRVLILGDVCEAKDAHRAALVNRVVDGLAALSEDVNVVILKGNHDYLSEDAPFFRFTQHLPRVRWINEPTQLKLRGLGSCMFLPHTNNHERDWGDLILNDCDWIFCHQTFDGADAGHGHTMGGVPRSIFPKGSRVVSGDVHVPQALGPVTYTGAPYTVDFGDEYSGRVLLLDHDDTTFIPVKIPQKRLVKITGSSVEDHLDKALSSNNAGDVVKVRVELEPDQAVERAQIRREVREWGEDNGVNVHTVQVVVAGDGARASCTTKPPRRQDDGELVRAYAKKRGLDGTVLKVGLKLMEET